MILKNYKRRRTSGGVFFWVAERIPCENEVRTKLTEIFESERMLFKDAYEMELQNGLTNQELGDRLLGRGKRNGLTTENF